MSRTRTLARLVTLGLGLGPLAGCPGPEPPPEPCAGPDDPWLTLSNRRAPVDLGEEGVVEIFPPPQGGIFTELDVVIEDMAVSELLYIYVVIDSVPAGEQYAVVRYFGNSIPLRCTEGEDGEGDRLEVANMPVGFTQMYEFEDLDGMPAKVTGTVETEAGMFPVEYDVMLRRTEY